ncbi:MAG: 1-deoxy-D-xylulose-5-phosphate synthase [Thermoguttaceae bacterium]|nr:1-deoxy-D-xylulose-5-phosphate synthase [Thermoguttaceae bacterium]
MMTFRKLPTPYPLPETLHLPEDLPKLSKGQLQTLAAEIREAICELLDHRSAHFASNLGVVELAIALHSVFDFTKDRLVWDTGHQIYPHKILTGRADRFETIRLRDGLMGYPNPAESDYDLFMTGHAGCSVSASLGLLCGDRVLRPEEGRKSVAVVGDGAFGCGVVFEAMNHAAGMSVPQIVILNDNRMSICPRVGGMGRYLDTLRGTPGYTYFKRSARMMVDRIPLIGTQTGRFLSNLKDSVKAALHGGALFEQLGFHYFGPIDGHDISMLKRYLRIAQQSPEPVLLHILTEKGHGFAPAEADPTKFHAPAPFSRQKKLDGVQVLFKSRQTSQTYTEVASVRLQHMMAQDTQVATIVAAMCQGTKLEAVREKYPDRFFDVGICEEHAVAFAAGLAKSGVHPFVCIYSTFMQRAYDQIFQEVSLQNLPVTLMLDRAGLVGPDGPTHHGAYDLSWLRHLPNLTIMAPGDARDLEGMIDFARRYFGPTAIRYPRSAATHITRKLTPIEHGKAEMLHRGRDGMFIVCGSLLETALSAADSLRNQGYDVGVVNARFIKPLDQSTLLRVLRETPVVLTVEENALAGGFGSALLEAACDAGISAVHVRRLGIPDQFVVHAERWEQLAEIGLSKVGMVEHFLEMASLHGVTPQPQPITLTVPAVA